VSPLQQQVNRAARLIAFVAVAAGLVFLVVGTAVAGLPLADALLFAIGLLVANVAEGLLPTITLALAVGVRRMTRRRALLKRLTAVETLGSTNVICTDKTGTLTEGRMVLSRFWSDGEELVPGRDSKVPGEPFAGLLRTAVRCSNAGLRRTSDGFERTGDPSESALLAAARLGEHVLYVPSPVGKSLPDRREQFLFALRAARFGPYGLVVDEAGRDQLVEDGGVLLVGALVDHPTHDLLVLFLCGH
jgi:magnesium-transporting ATPase (P-type)